MSIGLIIASGILIYYVGGRLLVWWLSTIL